MTTPYDHLNASEPFSIQVTMDELADKIVASNRGALRMVAALGRALIRRSMTSRVHPFDSAFAAILGGAAEAMITVSNRG